MEFPICKLFLKKTRLGAGWRVSIRGVGEGDNCNIFNNKGKFLKKKERIQGLGWAKVLLFISKNKEKRSFDGGLVALSRLELSLRRTINKTKTGVSSPPHPEIHSP